MVIFLLMATPEKNVKNKISALLKAYGADVCYYMPATGGYGRSGMPDYLGVAHGRAFAVEAKAPGGKVTALQERELAAYGAAGGTTFIVRDDLSLGLLGTWLGFRG